VYQGLLIIIIYFYFPISEELGFGFSYCFISISDICLAVICHSFPGVSGFLRNEFNSHFVFSLHFCLFCLKCCEGVGG
jgi:hypothetical protein